MMVIMTVVYWQNVRSILAFHLNRAAVLATLVGIGYHGRIDGPYSAFDRPKAVMEDET
jgi:hypothetical protein